MTMKTLITFVVCCLVALTTLAQNDTSMVSVARRSLDNFKKGVNADNFKMFKFSSLEEIQNASVGPEVSNSYIRLDELKAYREGDATRLVKSSQKRILILNNSNQQPIGSIEMEKVKNNWEMKSIGKLDVVEEFIGQTRQTQNERWTLIRVLALNRNFAARRVQNDLLVTLLGDAPLGEIQPRVEVPFTRVLPELQREANAYNGLPW